MSNKDKQDVCYDKCCKCGRSYFSFDSPMLKKDLWEKICPEENGYYNEHGRWKPFYMCIDCVEKELGHKLSEDDLLLSDRDRHVIWNTKFVNEHFPNHKYRSEKDDLCERIEMFLKEIENS